MIPSSRKASVLLIVLVTIVFATTMLVAFMERASDDLMIPTRQVDASRLRTEAYSALETVLAVLVDFRTVNGNLRSPAEGWGDPLTFADYVPANSKRTVTVTFEDESGKIPLPNVSDQNLTNFFTYLGLDTGQASFLKDSLFTWMKRNYSPIGTGATTATDYQQDTIPFTPPGRSLRSWSELASIEGLTETGDSTAAASATAISNFFYDANGHLTELGQRFIAAFSLYSFTTPNVNAGNRDALAVLGQMDETQVQAVEDYLQGGTGVGAAANIKNTGYFKSIGDFTTVAGLRGSPSGLGVNISALRIIVTVREGLSVFTLRALVSTSTGAATAVAAPAAPSQSTTGTTTSTISTATVQTPQLNYPYTILEISESDLDPTALEAQDQTADSLQPSS